MAKLVRVEKFKHSSTMDLQVQINMWLEEHPCFEFASMEYVRELEYSIVVFKKAST